MRRSCSRPCILLSPVGTPTSQTSRKTHTTQSVIRRMETAVYSDPSLLPPKQRRTRNRRPLAMRHNPTGPDGVLRPLSADGGLTQFISLAPCPVRVLHDHAR